MVARKDDKADEVAVSEDVKKDDAAKDEVTLSVRDADDEIPQFPQTGAHPEPGKGPDGVDAPTKEEKAAVLEAVTKPEITSVNPEPYSEAELNHRFNHVPPAGHVEHKPTIQF